MKKILSIIGLLMLIILVGCESTKFPSECEPQECFCSNKGMKYNCGDHKYETFWCENSCGEKVAFSLEEFEKFNYENKCKTIERKCS